MKNYICVLLASLSLLLISCNGSDDPEPAPGRTVLVYIAGDNNLGHDGFAASDVAEMVQGMEDVDTEKNNLLVYYDVGGTAQLLHLTKDKSGKVIKDIVREYNNRNSVGVTEMKEIFSLAFSQYAAASYGIVFWSHGDGWVPKKGTTRWFGVDGSNYMNITEMSEALSVAPHFDFIFFDACFMQSVEVAYELKEHCDYFVGSPTEIPGPGAPYQVVVPAMFKSTNAANAIAQTYFDYYNDMYTGVYPWSGEWGGGVSVSVAISAKLDELANETGEIISNYIASRSDINLSGILCYDKRGRNYEFYYDLDGFIRELTDGNEDYYRWSAAFEAASPYYKTTPRNFLNMFRCFRWMDPVGCLLMRPALKPEQTTPIMQLLNGTRLPVGIRLIDPDLFKTRKLLSIPGLRLLD